LFLFLAATCLASLLAIRARKILAAAGKIHDAPGSGAGEEAGAQVAQKRRSGHPKAHAAIKLEVFAGGVGWEGQDKGTDLCLVMIWRLMERRLLVLGRFYRRDPASRESRPARRFLESCFQHPCSIIRHVSSSTTAEKF
jgi:hypothetical protein